MHRCLIIFIFMLLILFPLACAGESTVTQEMQDAAAANNDFALDLYGKLQSESGNLFFSPLSLSTALSMAYAGARGNTASQMAVALHLNSMPADKVHESVGALARYLNRPNNDYQLAMANRLWGTATKDFEFEKQFLDLTRMQYGAEMERVDFSAGEQARRAINEWVEQQTQQKIKDVIPAGALNKLTRLVLTNAIYFKGKWREQFKKNATVNTDFFLGATDKVSVPMMNQKASFGLMDGEGLKVLELPYSGDNLSMLVLLPEKNDGLDELEKKLNTDNLKIWVGGLSKGDVQVMLPRFTMTWGAKLLNDPLKELGMVDAFDENKADFSGIGGKPGFLCISQVVHKAFIDVNEEGTEAAAATAVIMQTRAVAQRPRVFKADHPFVFLIRDTHSGAILFMGRIANPKG